MPILYWQKSPAALLRTRASLPAGKGAPLPALPHARAASQAAPASIMATEAAGTSRAA